jgi:carbon storage regulator
MLVLGRRPGEKIAIGENVVITVCDILRGKVRIGIDAPKDVVIRREEVVPREHPSCPLPTAHCPLSPPEPHERREPAPQLDQVTAIAAKIAGDLGGGDAIGPGLDQRDENRG